MTLNLTKGYYQIGMTEQVKCLSAFICETGSFQFNQMPFGLLAAGFTFQKLMLSILQPYHNFAATYIDDVIIFDNSYDEHIKHNEVICNCFKQNNLTIKPSKVQLCHDKVKFLL